MSPVKKIEDVIELAIRIERKSVEFYNRVHEMASDPYVKDVFSFLAAEEEKHLGAFRNLLEKAADYSPRYKYPGRIESFLNDLASISLDSMIKADQAAAAENADQAINVGKQLERESIEFYRKIRENIDDPESEFIKDVIKEEQSHLNRLETIKLKF
jgi:rubrerythrin